MCPFQCSKASLHVEFRPESFDGILLLTGERDDLTGDFMALLLHQGFVEFWFDCGSGMGRVKSEETIVLNQWNTITIYRHRWDAWLVLNQGNRVQGRSKSKRALQQYISLAEGCIASQRPQISSELFVYPTTKEFCALHRNCRIPTGESPTSPTVRCDPGNASETMTAKTQWRTFFPIGTELSSGGTGRASCSATSFFVPAE
uniref:LAM_G_DOMAIN domain-containing protein n=1 Tax=Anopheles maculatus TaxID=74869 RepID=A0A182SM83_9DIPT